MGKRWRSMGWVSVPFFSICLLSGCVRELSPVTGKKQSYAFSWSQEQQLGKESDAEIIQQFGLYEDPRVQSYVQEIGHGVLTHSDLRDKDAPAEYRGTLFTFRVLNSPVVNAFALPGGYVYVTRGLLTHLQNEAQLAVVLGHEVAHVAARHSARQALKAQVSQVGLLAGVILGSQVLDNPDAMQQVLGMGSAALQMLLTKYSRDAEREADTLGVKYAALRGYEPSTAAHFFESLSRLSEKEGVRLPSWQSTHPDPGERQQTILVLARQYERPQDIRSVGQEEFLARLEGMVVGDDPREGFVQSNMFYHPDLRFQFPVPPAWKVRNDRAAVLLVDPNRQALVALELVPVKSAQQGAERLAKMQGLQITRSGPTQVNSLNAFVVEATATTQQGTVGLIDYFIEWNGRVFSFLGYTDAQRLGNFRTFFDHVMRGFAPLRDERLLSVQPTRLTTVETRRSGPFRSFLPERLPPGLSAEDFAILNQARLDENIPVGVKLKLPR